ATALSCNLPVVTPIRTSPLPVNPIDMKPRVAAGAAAGMSQYPISNVAVTEQSGRPAAVLDRWRFATPSAQRLPTRVHAALADCDVNAPLAPSGTPPMTSGSVNGDP